MFVVIVVAAFQVDHLIVVVVPTIHSQIPWNLLPSLNLITPVAKAFEIIARFYVNLPIWTCAANNTVFASVYSLIILQYALVCSMDFLKRVNQKIAKGHENASKLRNV